MAAVLFKASLGPLPSLLRAHYKILSGMYVCKITNTIDVFTINAYYEIPNNRLLVSLPPLIYVDSYINYSSPLSIPPPLPEPRRIWLFSNLKWQAIVSCSALSYTHIVLYYNFH